MADALDAAAAAFAAIHGKALPVSFLTVFARESMRNLINAVIGNAERYALGVLPVRRRPSPSRYLLFLSYTDASMYLCNSCNKC
jgi:hypothetical protein